MDPNMDKENCGSVGTSGSVSAGGSHGRRRPRHMVMGWLCWGGCVKLEVMKKQGSDQAFHDRR